jgi:hypothetical protein
MDDRMNADLGIYQGEWVDACIDLSKVVLFYPDEDDNEVECVSVILQGHDTPVMVNEPFSSFCDYFMSNVPLPPL